MSATSGALEAADPKSFDSPDQVVAELIDSIQLADASVVAKFISEAQGKPEIYDQYHQILSSWLDGVSQVVEIKVVQEKTLGEMLFQTSLLVRDTKDTFIIFQAHIAKTTRGYLMYSVQFNTDISDFFPDWSDP